MFDNRLAEINAGEFEGKDESAETMKLLWKAVMSGDKGTESFKGFYETESAIFVIWLWKTIKGKTS